MGPEQLGQLSVTSVLGMKDWDRTGHAGREGIRRYRSAHTEL